MGVSHHSSEYEEMKGDFFDAIADWSRMADGTDNDLVNMLFSIMNDYGAVDWT